MLQLLFVQCKMLKISSKSALFSVLTWSSHKNLLLCCFSGSCSAADIEFYCERAIKETIDWSHYCLISPAAVLSLPAEWVYSETGDNKRALLHLSDPCIFLPSQSFPASLHRLLIPSDVLSFLSLYEDTSVHSVWKKNSWITLIHPFVWNPLLDPHSPLSAHPSLSPSDQPGSVSRKQLSPPCPPTRCYPGASWEWCSVADTVRAAVTVTKIGLNFLSPDKIRRHFISF